MSDDEIITTRQIAGFVSEELARYYQLGTVIVIVINESESQDGRLEIDASAHGGFTRTEHGARRIKEISEAIREAVKDAVRKTVKDAVRKTAYDQDAVVIERPDLEIPTTGERPKA